MRTASNQVAPMSEPATKRADVRWRPIQTMETTSGRLYANPKEHSVYLTTPPPQANKVITISRPETSSARVNATSPKHTVASSSPQGGKLATLIVPRPSTTNGTKPARQDPETVLPQTSLVAAPAQEITKSAPVYPRWYTPQLPAPFTGSSLPPPRYNLPAPPLPWMFTLPPLPRNPPPQLKPQTLHSYAYQSCLQARIDSISVRLLPIIQHPESFERNVLPSPVLKRNFNNVTVDSGFGAMSRSGSNEGSWEEGVKKVRFSGQAG